MITYSTIKPVPVFVCLNYLVSNFSENVHTSKIKYGNLKSFIININLTLHINLHNMTYIFVKSFLNTIILII